MEANVQTPAAPRGTPPKRRMRNYLLNRQFQLKYTGMVVGMTVMVAGFLGYIAYDYSHGQTELMTLSTMAQPDLDPSTVESILAQAADEDRKVLFGIIAGIGFLALVLGVTGIVVTHKVVGPAYKMRLLLDRVAAGKLELSGRLRKGDELQDVFESFANMVESLREAQSREIAELDAAILKAQEAGLDEETLALFVQMRARMQSALD